MGTTCQSTIRQFTDPVSLAPYCLRRVWDATPNPTGEGDADRDPWRILLAQYTLPGRDLFTGGLAVRRHRGGGRLSPPTYPFAAQGHWAEVGKGGIRVALGLGCPPRLSRSTPGRPGRL